MGFWASPASGQMTLYIDNATETLWFEGSASGNNSDLGGSGREAEWVSASTVDAIGDNLSLAGSFSLASGTLDGFSYINVNSAGIVRVRVSWTGSLFDTITGTGSSSAVSYAGLSEADRIAIEGLTNPMTKPPGSAGLDFPDLLVVQLNAIPEPANAAVLLGFTTLCCAAARRRRR